MIMTTSRAGRMSLATRLLAAAMLVAALAVTPILTATPDEPEFTGRPVDLVLEDADLDDVLATFSQVSAIEILVESGISGKVTAKFEQVPWDAALFTILRDQGLTWERTGDQLIVRRADSGGLVPVRPADGQPTARLAGKLDGEDVFRYVPDGKISEPVIIDKVMPKYPPEARKAGIKGIVVGDLMIDEIGMVRDVVIKESASDDLSTAAIEAFEQWRFEPAMMDGEPVVVRYIVTIKFNLK